jgi:hypothetical protein
MPKPSPIETSNRIIHRGREITERTLELKRVVHARGDRKSVETMENREDSDAVVQKIA